MKFNKILAIIVCLVIVMCPLAIVSALNNTNQASMIHVTTTGGNTKVFQKTANLEKGKTYTVSFKYKFVSGELNNAVYFMIHKAQHVVDSTASDKGKLYFDGRKSEQFESIVESTENYRTLSYTFKLDDREGLTIPNGTIKVDLGFYIEKKKCEFYFADFTVYETSDANKTNLLIYPDDSRGLYGWHSDYYTAGDNSVEFETSAYKAEILNYDEVLFKTVPQGPKMIHVTTTGGNTKVLQKTANLEKGKTYTVSFKYKFVSGELNNAVYFMIHKAQHVVDSTATDKGKLYFDGRKSEQFESIVESTEGYRTLSYTFKLDDREGLTIPDGTIKVDLGFYIEKKKCEFYFADFTVYETSDTDKTNLLVYPDDSRGLYGWHSDYYTASDDSVEFETSAYKAEVLNYDELLFKIISQGPKMIQLTAGGEDTKVFQKTANLEKGKTYTVSFKYKMASGEYNKSVYFMIHKAQHIVDSTATDKGKLYFDGRKSEQFESIVESTEGYRTLSYTFKLDDREGLTIPSGTVKVDLGFYIEKKQSEFYFADFTVYETSDANKTNLLIYPDDSRGLYGWHRDYATAEDISEEFSCNAYTAKLLDYDEKLFEIVKRAPQMIHVTATGESFNIFSKDAMLTKGKTYTVNFKYKFIEGRYNTSFYLTIHNNKKDTDNKVYFNGRNENCFSSVTTGVDGWREYYYTFVFDDYDDVVIPQGESEVALGFVFEKQKSEFYFADFTIYEADDTDKNCLLKYPGDKRGLYGWHRDYAAAEDESDVFTCKAYTAELLDFDASIFEYQAPPVTGPQILYFKNGADWKMIGVTTSNVKIGETYRFEYSLSSKVVINPSASATGNRDSISKSFVMVEKIEYDDYYHVVYEITIPAKTEKETDMTQQAIVGITFPANANGYLFDVKFYQKDKPEKQLIPNNEWCNGLDNWMFDWKAWFIEGRTGLGFREWSDNGKILKVIDYDLTKIIQYVDDSHFNDGVWWNSEDIVEEVVGKGTLKGYLKDQNGKSFGNIKMLLESANATYTTITKGNGYYEFSNIVPGFYQLFTIGKNGEKYDAGFFRNIKDKEDYSLNIVCDWSKNTSDVKNDLSADSMLETKEPSGTLKCGVYTPDLKPVANLKVFIGDKGETVTDKDGLFEFSDIPVGNYEIYTVENGNKYVFKTVSIKENIELSVKLKYDVSQANTVTADDGTSVTLIIVLVSAGVLVIAGAGIFSFIFIKKAKKK